MAVTVKCSNPQGLLDSIKQAIACGKIDTWLVDADGDFTHTPNQWKHCAWLCPKVSNDELIFHILAPRGKTISAVDYAVYHGRFIEMLLTHFDGNFRLASASSMPSSGDIITGN